MEYRSCSALDGDQIDAYWQTAIACRLRQTALNRVIGDYRGTYVARVGHLAEGRSPRFGRPLAAGTAGPF